MRGKPTTDLGELFKKSRAFLCKAIKKAKSEAWNILLKTLDDDLWGLPYKLVMDRLKRSDPGMTFWSGKLLRNCWMSYSRLEKSTTPNPSGEDSVISI